MMDDDFVRKHDVRSTRMLGIDSLWQHNSWPLLCVFSSILAFSEHNHSSSGGSSSSGGDGSVTRVVTLSAQTTTIYASRVRHSLYALASLRIHGAFSIV